jgi:hypothetical protein
MALPKPTDSLRELLGDLIHTAVNCENDARLVDSYFRKRPAKKAAAPGPPAQRPDGAAAAT